MSTFPTLSDPFEGTWETVRAELAGEPVPELVVRQTVLTLARGSYAVYFNRQLADSGDYTLAPGQPHAALVLQGRVGPNAGRTIPAIYQLMGERLRICYGLAGDAPAAFATTAGSQLYLVIYRRKTG